MVIANFTEREVLECGLTVVGDLDQNGGWLPLESDVAHAPRLADDEDEEFEDDDLEDDDLDEEELEDDFEDEDEFEDDDDFDDDDDFEDDDDLDADDDEDY